MGPDLAPALLRILTVLFAADAIGLVAFAVVPRLRRGRRVVAAVFATAVLAAPYFGPPASRKLCAGLALILIHVALRIVDCARFPPASWRIQFLNLLPFPFFLGVREEWNHALAYRPVLRQDEAGRMAAGWIGFGFAWLALLTIGQTDFLASHLWLDHLLKLPLFVFAVETVAAGTWSLERILGFDSMPLMNRFYRARTPAEFWNRYNLRVHTWLTRNAFLPAGGKRHPMRGIWAVFIVSAVIHELAFDVVTGVVDGTQAAFFLLQAPAVLLSRPLERFARRNGRVGDTTARMITWIWFAASSLLFFQQVSRVFPFYYAGGTVGAS